jgi:hypothetical protein
VQLDSVRGPADWLSEVSVLEIQLEIALQSDSVTSIYIKYYASNISSHAMLPAVPLCLHQEA